MVHYHYHGENMVITRSFPSMVLIVLPMTLMLIPFPQYLLSNLVCSCFIVAELHTSASSFLAYRILRIGIATTSIDTCIPREVHWSTIQIIFTVKFDPTLQKTLLPIITVLTFDFTTLLQLILLQTRVLKFLLVKLLLFTWEKLGIVTVLPGTGQVHIAHLTFLVTLVLLTSPSNMHTEALLP